MGFHLIIAFLSTAAMITVRANAQIPAEPQKVRLGLFTAMPVKWELDRNWETFQSIFLAHVNDGIDVVVTPECFLDGYAVSAKNWIPEHIARIAQDVSTSPYIARVRAMAEKYKTAILFGFTERAGSRMYNCALMVDRTAAWQAIITRRTCKPMIFDLVLDKTCRFSPCLGVRREF